MIILCHRVTMLKITDRHKIFCMFVGAVEKVFLCSLERQNSLKGSTVCKNQILLTVTE